MGHRGQSLEAFHRASLALWPGLVLSLLLSEERQYTEGTEAQGPAQASGQGPWEEWAGPEGPRRE